MIPLSRMVAHKKLYYLKVPTKVGLIVFAVLLVDQASKIWVKTHMEYGQEFQIFGIPWALIHFVENNGMAFGISMGGEYGKLLLSLFRIVAVGFLLFFIRKLIQENAGMRMLIGFALILAGAIGNILDSAFYGMIFSESPYYGGLATLFPPEGGYAGFLHGRVVDMLYFPVFKGVWPEWVPYLGGQFFLFFKPVFNVADMAITTGVIQIILFQRQFFQKPEDVESQVEKETETEDLPPATPAEDTQQEQG